MNSTLNVDSNLDNSRNNEKLYHVFEADQADESRPFSTFNEQAEIARLMVTKTKKIYKIFFSNKLNLNQASTNLDKIDFVLVYHKESKSVVCTNTFLKNLIVNGLEIEVKVLNSTVQN